MYVVFANGFGPGGKWGDITGTFATLEEAKKRAEDDTKWAGTWARIYEIRGGSIYKRAEYNYTEPVETEPVEPKPVIYEREVYEENNDKTIWHGFPADE